MTHTIVICISPFLTYHRKDGKLVNQNDDQTAEKRYGVMMLRYAKSREQYARSRQT